VWDTLTFRFDSSPPIMSIEKGYIDESPLGYDGILDVTCTFTPSVSINKSLQNKVISISIAH